MKQFFDEFYSKMYNICSYNRWEGCNIIIILYNNHYFRSNFIIQLIYILISACTLYVVCLVDI